jgi:hypothetical protein
MFLGIFMIYGLCATGGKHEWPKIRLYGACATLLHEVKPQKRVVLKSYGVCATLFHIGIKSS